MASSSSQQPSLKPIYDEAAFEARIKERRLQMLLSERVKHPKASNFGPTILPIGNMTPVDIAVETEALPHTQIRTQNFLSINPNETRPKNAPQVSMIPFMPDITEVPVLRLPDMEAESVMAILTAFAYPFFCEKLLQVTATNADVYRAWCTLYGSIDSKFNSAIANTGMDAADRQLIITEYTDIELYMAAMGRQARGYEKLVALMESRGIDDKNTLLVIMCVLCQTAGKFVYADNYLKWYTNRLKAASGAIGGCALDNAIAETPAMNGLQIGNTALNSVFGFRRMLIDRMFVYADSRSKLGKMFSLTLQMLASTDLTHVYNIDLYIVKLVPEIMNLHILRSYDDQLVEMYKFWLKHHDIFPYIRFYIEPKECHSINRNVLMPLIVASHAVATYVCDTFQNYKGSSLDSAFAKDIKKTVGDYLQSRKDLAGLAMGASERAIATEVERNQMLTLSVAGPASSATAQLARELAALQTNP